VGRLRYIEDVNRIVSRCKKSVNNSINDSVTSLDVINTDEVRICVVLTAAQLSLNMVSERIVGSVYCFFYSDAEGGTFPEAVVHTL
jgi:signal transduction histidine kinase